LRAEERSWNLADYTILFVEDVETCREPVIRILKKAGYRVIAAHGVRDAVTALEESRVDLVLLDLALPDDDGLDLLQLVRGRLGLRHLPVIIFSGSGDVSRLTEDLKVSACLTKSIATMKDLLAAIAKALATPAP
jgi:two-component system KDP operon response regulator KdpE